MEKKDFILALFGGYVSLSHQRLAPSLLLYQKTITIQNTKIRNSKCRGFFIVRVVLDDACRVGIFPTFCRPFETRWCSDMIMQMLYTSLGPVALGNGPQFYKKQNVEMEEFLGRQIYFTGTTCECLPHSNGTRSGDFEHEKKTGKFVSKKSLPRCFVNVQFLGGYRWRSPSDRLVRYNETLVLPPSSTKVSRRRNWCTTSKGALYSGCWTLFDWGEIRLAAMIYNQFPVCFLSTLWTLFFHLVGSRPSEFLVSLKISSSSLSCSRHFSCTSLSNLAHRNTCAETRLTSWSTPKVVCRVVDLVSVWIFLGFLTLRYSTPYGGNKANDIPSY